MTKQEEDFVNDLTAFMIRHNVIFVKDDFDHVTIINADNTINLSMFSWLSKFPSK